MSLCLRQHGPPARSQGQARLFRVALHKLSPVGEIPIINTPMTLAQTETININSEGIDAATTASADATTTSACQAVVVRHACEAKQGKIRKKKSLPTLSLNKGLPRLHQSAWGGARLAICSISKRGTVQKTAQQMTNEINTAVINSRSFLLFLCYNFHLHAASLFQSISNPFLLPSSLPVCAFLCWDDSHLHSQSSLDQGSSL